MKSATFMLLLATGCSFGHQDKERLGDAAWHEGRWTEALAAYRAAGDSPRLTAKIADVSLQAGLLAESAAAWLQVGTEAPERAAEAAAGLARVAAAAEDDGKQVGLVQAMFGLRQIAPTWPLGRIASRMGAPGELSPAEAVQVIPALLTATSVPSAADPLLLALARANHARGSCDLAVPILEGVLRRTTTNELRDTATTTLAACELGLGLRALDGGHPGDAERWLDRAVHRVPDAAVGRRALVAFGEARLGQGDTVTARVVWQSITAAGTTPDSITQLASQRLLQTAPPVVVDSGIVPPGRP